MSRSLAEKDTKNWRQNVKKTSWYHARELSYIAPYQTYLWPAHSHGNSCQIHKSLFFQKYVPLYFKGHLSRIMTKPTKWHVCPTKTQVSLGVRPVWSESLLSAWRSIELLATCWAHSEGSDQTGQMPRLIWVFTGRERSFCWFCYEVAHFCLIYYRGSSQRHRCSLSPVVRWQGGTLQG